MASSTTTTATQILSISTALMGAGGIATLSIFDIPILESQPASRSLPSIRWLFSRGSHIFPTAAAVSFAGFTYLAYVALPVGRQSLLQILNLAGNERNVNAYLAAGVLCMSIAPITSLMLPTNFKLIELNEKAGGSRSIASARQRQQSGGVGGGEAMTAEASVAGKDQPSQMTDLSGPQAQTTRNVSREEDDLVRELLGSFKVMNLWRAAMMAVGGMVGVWAAVI